MTPSGGNNSPLQMFSSNWISLVPELYQGIQQFLKNRSHDGIYEMLEYESVLELSDPQGKVAVFKKRQRVRFLQDNVIAFQDHAWGDGEFLQNYRCSPGMVVDRYKDGNRWNVLISLWETKSTGDIVDFQIQRKLGNAFRKKEEWWQIVMYHQTRRLKLSLIFPKRRHCHSARLVERNRNRTELLDSEHYADLPDGRQIVTWERERPVRFETYTLKWRW